MEATLRRITSAIGDAIISSQRQRVVQPSVKSRLLKRKKEKPGLPLLLPSSWPPPTPEGMEVIHEVMEAFGDISARLLSILHAVCKNLHFWETRAQGIDALKVHFMLFERGPRAFLEGIEVIVCSVIRKQSPLQNLVYSASTSITEKVRVLKDLQCRLAGLVAQVYKEVDKLGEDLAQGQNFHALRAALIALYTAMTNFDGVYDLPEANCIPDKLVTETNWTDSDVLHVLEVLYKNLDNLQQTIADLVRRYKKPRKITRFWLRYSGGAIVFTLISGWLVWHSPLGGSDDMNRWLRSGSDAIVGFWKEHVEEPLLSIRDDLFETFRKRHQGTAELEDVRIAAGSLNRMLKAFAEQTTGQALPPNITEQQMMEIMMSRYEKELTHPLQSLLGGELARALLIQVQKLKLDIETAMLELNQILRANEINFAILAALPALATAVLVVAVLRMYFSQGKGAEGRGRAAQLRRRMLVAEAEKEIIYSQLSIDNGHEQEGLWHYGMVIYALDRLYKAVETNKTFSSEWSSLRGDILELAKPKLSTVYKLAITARMERIYECIVPLPKRNR
ncbi:hypothetical protein O6H91_02G073500 [Diphasiastrum complanatum]|uniref:Uncharacterized protein n=1 Tax=Diphasiastrum complanatum TaxID=34168 RepID=A0ACC2EHF8_DIPCM|nr:hypothetical protein O6H91_02G073500 [Diphasiastrum complanatum]